MGLTSGACNENVRLIYDVGGHINPDLLQGVMPGQLHPMSNGTNAISTLVTRGGITQTE
jgi:hypothetical protein